MPEGDTIFRLSRRLDRALGGLVLEEVSAGDLAFAAQDLCGARVRRVEARGKHLLLFFEDGRVLHVHLGMTGRWRLSRARGVIRRGSRRLRIGLHVAGVSALCFDAPVVELLLERDLGRHPRLARLGPDLAAAEFDAERARNRLRELGDSVIGEALLDQRALAGIGNVYKSELLFRSRIDPFARVADLDDATLDTLIARARTLLRRNVGPGARTTRFAADGPRLWVYGRAGQHCLVCGARVGMRRQGSAGRSTYFCSACQNVGGATGESDRSDTGRRI